MGAAGLAATGFGSLARAALSNIQVAAPTYDPTRLVALPGKGPMIQVYDKPPVYETPLSKMIGQELYPLTDRDYYYVRWREAFIPEIRPEDFRIEVTGDAVEQPRTFTLDELKEFGEVSVAAVGSCKRNASGRLRPVLGGVPWGKGDVSAAKWTGVPVKAVLESVGVKNNAVQVAFKSAGPTVARSEPEYWRVQSVDEMMQPKAILAYKMNDGEMPLWNGAPLRLVNPGEYAPEWVKQVVRIEVRSTPIENLWAGKNPGGPDPIKIVSMITTPEDGSRLRAGQETVLTGVAYDSGIGIAKVEVSLDQGRTWEAAQLEEPKQGRYAWRVFRHRITPRQKGPLRLLTRATGSKGESQPFDPTEEDWNSNGRRMNSVMAFSTEVEVV